LNINFGIINERQVYKKDTVLMSTCGGGRGSGGDDIEGIWLMELLYI
jgi:hypothetical protein